MQFTSPTTFVVNACAPGFCATRTPPTKNPCIGRANAERVDKVAPPQPVGAGGAGAAGATATAPLPVPTLLSLEQVRIQNAQDAVQGNLAKDRVQLGDACAPEGVVKCMGNAAVMCTGGRIVGPLTVCPAGQECSVLPNVAQPGTVQRCNPVADTAARIAVGLQGKS
jgi:hypothetical protein